MFSERPKTKPWISWSYVVLTVVVIFLTVPIAGKVRELATLHANRQVFGFVVIGSVLLAGIYTAQWLRKNSAKVSNYIWLAFVAGCYTYFTVQLRNNPEEAIHLLEYGFLGLMSYRALLHHVRDKSIYLIALLLCATVGTVEEIFQWAIPNRVWDLRDVGLNTLAGFLCQIGIGKGIRPTVIDSALKSYSVQLASRLVVFQLLLLGLCMSNTPDRINWYSKKLPFLGFLRGDVMIEYGYRHEEPEIGIFFSRFTKDQLVELDREQGDKVAKVLDSFAFSDRDSYRRFLRSYTPVNAPFTHEAGVHLFVRDIHSLWGFENRSNPDLFKYHLNRAHREHRLLELYFPTTLRSSNHSLSTESIDLLRSNRKDDVLFVSPVSRQLITNFSERDIWFIILGALCVTQLASLWLVRRLE